MQKFKGGKMKDMMCKCNGLIKEVHKEVKADEIKHYGICTACGLMSIDTYKVEFDNRKFYTEE